MHPLQRMLISMTIVAILLWVIGQNGRMAVSDVSKDIAVLSLIPLIMTLGKSGLAQRMMREIIRMVRMMIRKGNMMMNI